MNARILSMILIILIQFWSFAYAEDSSVSGLPDQLSSYLGNWNPSDVGPDNPDLEDYKWYTRTVNGIVYKSTVDDVFFKEENGVFTFGGQGGGLIIDKVKSNRQSLYLTVHTKESGVTRPLQGVVQLLRIDMNKFAFHFNLPSTWENKFGSENVVYIRAQVVK